MAAPILQNTTPAHGALDVLTTSDIILEVVDGGTGLDATSVEIYLQEVLVWQSEAAQNGYTVTRTPVTGGHQYTVEPGSALSVGSGVAVHVIADDGSSDMLYESFAFVTAYSAPGLKDNTPAPSSSDVALDSNIELTINGLEHAVLGVTKLGKNMVLGASGGNPTSINESSVVLKVQNVICWQNGAAVGDFGVTKTVQPDGTSLKYVINPHCLLPAGTTVTVAVYAEDLQATPGVLDTTWTFDTTATETYPIKMTMGGVWLDYVSNLTGPNDLHLANRIPVSDSIGVDADEPVLFSIFDTRTAGTGLSKDLKVWVNTLVYDQALAQTAAGWTVTDTFDQSPGSAVDDVNHLKLEHTTDFISEEVVYVEITASTDGGGSIATIWQFTIKDVLAPALVSAVSWDYRKVKVKFNEEMLTDSTDRRSMYYVLDVSGQNTFVAPNIINCPTADIPAGVDGMFIGVHGALKAPNNGPKTITERTSATQVKVAETIVNESPPDPTQDDPPQLYLSGFKVEPTPAAANVVDPGTHGIVKAAAAPSTFSLGTGEVADKIAILTLIDDLSPGRDCTLYAANRADDAYNVVSGTASFLGWQPQYWTKAGAGATPEASGGPLARRDFGLWDMIPQFNKDEDVTRDAEKLVKCLDDVARVLLQDVDRFGNILDPDITPEHVLPHLLEHLGNPFRFIDGLSSERKRAIIPLLVRIYRNKGCASNIEEAIEYFLSITTTVRPYYRPDAHWKLGVHQLGLTTILGPDLGWARYSFEVVLTASEPTAAQKLIIKEIVDALRPCHTHYARLVWTGGSGVP